jgi:(p)ppGpp synthase/HD superfamily hydrolase
MRLEERAAVDALADAWEALGDAYRGVSTKAGKGVEHARQVAGILRAGGYPDSVQVAGLLHDVVEDTPWTVEHVAARFGPGVAGLVGALTEETTSAAIAGASGRLREQIAAAGAPATDVALADKIAQRCRRWRSPM